MVFSQSPAPGLACRQPASRVVELLGQLLPLAFQRPQPPDIRAVRGTGQVREHVDLPERLHHQFRGGARMRHQRPVRPGNVSLGQRTTPKLADLGFGFRAAEAVDRIAVLPVQNLLRELRQAPRLRRNLHEVSMNPVLGLVGLELDSCLGGNPAEIGEAETRAADRTVVAVPDLPERAPAGRGNRVLCPGARGPVELGALHRHRLVEVQFRFRCRTSARTAGPLVANEVVLPVRKEGSRASRLPRTAFFRWSSFRGMQEL